MKNVLFPTDFSDAADYAKKAAFKLCKKHNLTLHVMNSLDNVHRYVSMSMTNAGDPSVPGFEPELMLEAMKEHKKQAEKDLLALKEEAEKAGIQVEGHLKSGKMHDDVQEVVEKFDIDFIIMGTHGASGFEEAFIGSNAQKVVRSANVPVLTIKPVEENKTFDVKRIVFASDFLEEEINNEIPKVRAFANFLEASLEVVYINTPSYFEQTVDSERRIRKVLDKNSMKDVKFTIFNDFNIDDGIVNFADHVEGDVIALITHGFSGLKKFLNDNITETVVNHSSRPVLSFQMPKD
jgi:nucleotide-binding universal stress UspA family protein